MPNACYFSRRACGTNSVGFLKILGVPHYELLASLVFSLKWQKNRPKTQNRHPCCQHEYILFTWTCRSTALFTIDYHMIPTLISVENINCTLLNRFFRVCSLKHNLSHMHVENKQAISRMVLSILWLVAAVNALGRRGWVYVHIVSSIIPQGR